jgi:rare lipoprotein A
MVRPTRAAARGAIVHADAGGAALRAMGARRAKFVLAVAALAGLGVAIGCASEASARRRAAPVGKVQEGEASFYAPKFAGRRTASGERYDPKGMTAAHKTLPLGTRIRVTRVGGPSVVVRVNDRCGCQHGRIVDLSEAAARKLDMMRAGVVPVRLEVIR